MNIKRLLRNIGIVILLIITFSILLNSCNRRALSPELKERIEIFSNKDK